MDKNGLRPINLLKMKTILVFGKPQKPNGGRSSREYILTIDMAKELSMVENNEQGRVARRYFINCEKHCDKQHLINEPIQQSCIRV